VLIGQVRGAVVVAFLAYVVLSVAGLVLLRANLAEAVALVRAGDWFSRAVAVGFAGALCYGVSFALWLVVLANVPLSRAYPLAVGATLAFSTVFAWALLGERMTVRLVAGILAIFAGVVLVTTS
jgi:multidrug transporter EmrE-like cation transporter